MSTPASQGFCVMHKERNAWLFSLLFSEDHVVNEVEIFGEGQELLFPISWTEIGVGQWNFAIESVRAVGRV